MGIAVTDPEDFPNTANSLNLKAEALVRRKREKREEEIRQAQRKADAALVRAAVKHHVDEAQKLLDEGNWLPTDRACHKFAGEVLAALADLLEGKP